jgi:hypothetical protein
VALSKVRADIKIQKLENGLFYLRLNSKTIYLTAHNGLKNSDLWFYPLSKGAIYGRKVAEIH